MLSARVWRSLCRVAFRASSRRAHAKSTQRHLTLPEKVLQDSLTANRIAPEASRAADKTVRSLYELLHARNVRMTNSLTAGVANRLAAKPDNLQKFAELEGLDTKISPKAAVAHVQSLIDGSHLEVMPFGSTLIGNAAKGSDIDVVIVLPESAERALHRLLLASDLGDVPSADYLDHCAESFDENALRQRTRGNMIHVLRELYHVVDELEGAGDFELERLSRRVMQRNAAVVENDGVVDELEDKALRRDVSRLTTWKNNVMLLHPAVPILSVRYATYSINDREREWRITRHFSELDVTVGSRLAVSKSMWVQRTLASSHSRVRALSVLTKQAAKHMQLVAPKKGGFNSFTLLLLLLSFSAQRGLAPRMSAQLAEMVAELQSDNDDGDESLQEIDGVVGDSEDEPLVQQPEETEQPYSTSHRDFVPVDLVRKFRALERALGKDSPLLDPKLDDVLTGTPNNECTLRLLADFFTHVALLARGGRPIDVPEHKVHTADIEEVLGTSQVIASPVCGHDAMYHATTQRLGALGQSLEQEYDTLSNEYDEYYDDDDLFSDADSSADAHSTGSDGDAHDSSTDSDGDVRDSDTVTDADLESMQRSALLHTAACEYLEQVAPGVTPANMWLVPDPLNETDNCARSVTVKTAALGTRAAHLAANLRLALELRDQSLDPALTPDQKRDLEERSALILLRIFRVPDKYRRFRSKKKRGQKQKHRKTSNNDTKDKAPHRRQPQRRFVDAGVADRAVDEQRAFRTSVAAAKEAQPM